MKKLILIALVCSALSSSATGYFGIKPIVTEPTCYGGNTGSISLSLVGGLAPYSYNWSNGATSAILNNLAAGTYNVTVVDANNISATYSVAMKEPYQLLASTVTQNGGLGQNNGYINLSVDGGTPGYSYDWSNGATTQNISGLAPGTYTVTVTDAAGCTTTTSHQVLHPVHFTGAPTNGNDPRSMGSSDNSNSSSVAPAKLGTPELKSSDVLVFPNPANSAFTLKTGEVNNALISLIDINGQVLSQQKAESNETSINVSNLPKGTYIVEIKTENGSVNKTVSVK